MNKQEKQIKGLEKLGIYIKNFLDTSKESFSEEDMVFYKKLKVAQLENPWFTDKNLRFCLKHWSEILTYDTISNWVSEYKLNSNKKRVGLILAGNIPLVGFHDVISVVLSNHIPLIKLSSKDKQLLPFLLEKWNSFSEENIEFEYVERLTDFDVVIATGSNNTARYLEFYFKNHLSIIRKNRTSIAILKGSETDLDLQLLSKDIFTYFGMGCRNVTRLFIPKDFNLDRLFHNFLDYKEIINHHSYANNYDYNKAIYLLNQDLFWDNNFVMLREDSSLFSPISVLHYSRYENIKEVEDFVKIHHQEIQCVVGIPTDNLETIAFGTSQKPDLQQYADQVDTMKFLEVI